MTKRNKSVNFWVHPFLAPINLQKQLLFLMLRARLRWQSKSHKARCPSRLAFLAQLQRFHYLPLTVGLHGITNTTPQKSANDINLVNSNVLLSLVGLSKQGDFSFKFVPKKVTFPKRTWQKRAYDFCSTSILFLCAIFIYYIPYNYVIPQAMPHAIPQTHSSFYLHRIQNILKLCCNLGTETHGRLAWQFWKFRAKIKG